jgi:sporulation protein YlmC with PRC-barrel domain
LHLLDRQLIDRDGHMCGNVDDLELEQAKNGTLFVSGIHAGPGTLSRRLGWRRWGEWLSEVHEKVDQQKRVYVIPLCRVTKVGSAVTVDYEASELATESTQKWVRDHIIGRIPGARHAAQ